jgi:hypothetical protein
LSKKFINIILLFIVLALLTLDALAIHDVFVEEPDLFYEIGMISVSILVFIAIGVYLKQRKGKSTQLE